jgi:UDP-glucose 4-epimerase
MATGKTHIITGGAGFIGVNLAKSLIDRGDNVFIIDNLSRGRKEFVDRLGGPNRVQFAQVDVSDGTALERTLSPVRDKDVEVWHLCANSDIPAGVTDPNVDLKDTFLVTHELLIAMRNFGWSRLHFASTSAVYGDHGEGELNEETFCEPISNYGAMKLASEAAIRAATEAFLSRSSIFRFPNVIGTPATHGVILDFLGKLGNDNSVLPVLGNGTQRKSYLHVRQLIEAMLWIYDHGPDGWAIHNIGPSDSGVTVKEIAELTRDYVAPQARLLFGIEDRGWVGDVPRFTYDVSKLTKLGWSSSMTSREAVQTAIKEIAAQENVNRGIA